MIKRAISETDIYLEKYLQIICTPIVASAC